MSDRLTEALVKYLDLLFSRRALATAGAILLLVFRNQIGLDADTVKLIVATLVGWIVSDGMRATESRASNPRRQRRITLGEETIEDQQSNPPPTPTA